MGDVIGDHISELLGGQGQPLVDEDAGEELDTGIDDGQGGSEPPAASDSEPPATGDAPAPTTKRGQKVPLAALQEERTRRQTAETQIQSQQQQIANMEARFQQMMQLVQQNRQQEAPQQEAPQVPTFLDDPEGHVNALKEQFEEKIRQLQQYQNQQVQQYQQDEAINQLAQYAAAHEVEFAKTTPDYQAAADFYTNRRIAEYTAMGADPISIQKQIRIDFARVAHQARSMNLNPAKMLYDTATALGYVKAQQQQAQKPGVPAAPKVTAAPAPTSLSNMAGAVQSPDEQGEVSLQSIADMSDAEFDKFWNTMKRGSVQRPKF